MVGGAGREPPAVEIVLGIQYVVVVARVHLYLKAWTNRGKRGEALMLGVGGTPLWLSLDTAAFGAGIDWGTSSLAASAACEVCGGGGGAGFRVRLACEVSQRHSSTMLSLCP